MLFRSSAGMKLLLSHGHALLRNGKVAEAAEAVRRARAHLHEIQVQAGVLALLVAELDVLVRDADPALRRGLGAVAQSVTLSALFVAIKAAVLAIVVQALIRIGGRALNTRFKQALAFAAFLGLFLFNLPFPLVVLGSGVIGMIVAARQPDWLALKANASAVLPPRPPIMAMVRTVLLWG